MTIVYRIQPIGAKLHGIETTTSNDEAAGGVHVFGSLAEVYACREWCEQSDVELATIECEARDLRANGDYEGETLRKGRGRITARQTFATTRAIADWVEQHTKTRS